MKERTIILGEHPIAGVLVQQWGELGREVECHSDLSVDVSLDGCSELVLLSSGDDNAVLKRLLELSQCTIGLTPTPSPEGEGSHVTPESDSPLPLERGGGEAHNSQCTISTQEPVRDKNDGRLTCHLLLDSQDTLQMLQSCDLNERITHKMDVYPTTMTEVWSRKLQFDYEPITLQSEKHVHLVIFGFDEMAQAVALHAARVAHYPNYVRDHSLRTRITVIAPSATHRCEQWIAHYQSLFDNSYYRLVKPDKEHAVTQLHRPMYEGQREDFVDVEWEFVDATVSHPVVQEKLKLWSQDSRQLLSIVITGVHDPQNITRALLLPDAVFTSAAPIHIQQQDDVALRATRLAGKYSRLHPFGMLDRGYDVTLPWVMMGKTVNHIYDQFYHANAGHLDDKQWQMRYAVEVDPIARDQSWARLSSAKRQSSISNALSVATKLRSIGLDDDDWSGFFDIPQHELELLAQVEHNRWSVEQLILGYRPCTDAEQTSIDQDIALKAKYKADKVHYDLRAYSDLRPDETGKSVEIYDLCLCAALPLICSMHNS